MSTLFRITALGFISLIIGISTNQLIRQGIRWPILLLAFSRVENTIPLTTIPTDEVYTLLQDNGSTIIDIRPKIEFEIDHVPTAFSMPFYQFFGKKIYWKQQIKMILSLFMVLNLRIKMLNNLPYIL